MHRVSIVYRSGGHVKGLHVMEIIIDEKFIHLDRGTIPKVSVVSFKVDYV